MPSQVTPLDLEGDCQWPLGVKKREEESQTAEVKTRHYAKEPSKSACSVMFNKYTDKVRYIDK